MDDGSDSARFVFWMVLLLGWPFFLWQLYCLLNQQPVPLLGRGRGGGGPVDPVGMDPGNMQVLIWSLLAEGVIILVITVIAYSRSGFGRR
jgi:hypothetical protein